MPVHMVAKRIGDEVATVMKVYAHSNAEDDQVLADTYEQVLENAQDRPATKLRPNLENARNDGMKNRDLRTKWRARTDSNRQPSDPKTSQHRMLVSVGSV